METEKSLLMHQRKYVKEMVKWFKMAGCNQSTTQVDANVKLEKCADERLVDATTFKQIVGCLRYLCHNRPNISYGVGMINMLMEAPKMSHLIAGKRMLRYLQGTID